MMERGYTFFLGCMYIMVLGVAVNVALSVWVARSFQNNRFDHVWWVAGPSLIIAVYWWGGGSNMIMSGDWVAGVSSMIIACIQTTTIWNTKKFIFKTYFVAGWRHALRSEWPFIIIIII